MKSLRISCQLFLYHTTPYLHGEPTKAVATIVFDSEIPEDAVKLEEVSTSYELLSEEDLEELFNI